jgi:5-oxopent-3-ene-1,2,5-tricarboxylate decarboxylase/2-hydroxyhepta-2,4-diene-1,7-dioate isomerase
MGGGIALVIDKTASRVRPTDALDFVGGLALCNDVSIPYDSHYRPAIKQRCRDGFCPIGPTVPRPADLDPDRLEVVIEINGAIRSRSTGGDLVRGARQLLTEVSRFITFEPGDWLALGEPHDAPLAGPRGRVRIVVPELGALENQIVAAP